MKKINDGKKSNHNLPTHPLTKKFIGGLPMQKFYVTQYTQSVLKKIGGFQNKSSMNENQNEERNDRSRSAKRSGSNNDNSESDNEPIEPNRRRQSMTSLNFAKVMGIFPELDTDVLCKLSKLSDKRPSKVLELIPGASALQIGAFL